MTRTDAELMRQMMQVIEKSSIKTNQPLVESNQVTEAFPVLKQALKSKLTGLASKFSKRMAGRNQVQKALVPYLSMFVTHMGRKNQNWNTVTWRTVINYLTGNASLKIPLGDFEPQRLTFQDIAMIIADDNSRKTIMKYLGNQSNLLVNLMPKNITNKLNDPVSINMEDGSNIAQKLITGLFVEAIQTMFDKAQATSQYQTATQNTQAHSAASTPVQAHSAASRPANVTNSNRTINPVAQQLNSLTSRGIPPTQLRDILNVFKGI